MGTIQIKNHKKIPKSQPTITFLRIILVIFIIQPLVLIPFLFLLSILDGLSFDVFNIGLQIFLGILYIYVNLITLKNKFNLSIWNAILLYIITGSIFFVLCGGAILISI